MTEEKLQRLKGGWAFVFQLNDELHSLPLPPPLTKHQQARETKVKEKTSSQGENDEKIQYKTLYILKGSYLLDILTLR